MMDPLPSFLCVRSMLLMEEMQQANAAANAAYTPSSPSIIPLLPCTGQGCRGEGSTSGKPKPYYGPKTKTGGQGRQGGGAPASTRQSTPAPAGPWVCFSPGVG
jgi:hypothetical protein